MTELRKDATKSQWQPELVKVEVYRPGCNCSRVRITIGKHGLMCVLCGNEYAGEIMPLVPYEATAPKRREALLQ